MDAPPDEDKTDDEPEGLEGGSSAAWEHETKQVKRKSEMQPSSSSSLVRPRGDAMLSQTDEKPLRRVSKQPTKSSNQESRAGYLSMDVTSSASQQKRFVNRPGQFVARQLRNRKFEVSAKNLSQDELRQLEQAKPNEIRQYVTVKHFPKKKVSARLVILGYQVGDLEDELLEAATPTPTRRAKHCFLQVAAHHGFELKKADVSGAFLQGREKNRQSKKDAQHMETV